MLSWSKGKPRDLEIRDTLFGDMPIEQWLNVPAEVATSQPWEPFALARRAADAGDRHDAAAMLQGVTAMPDLESRVYLQAFHFLRGWGISPPPARAKEVLGVVVEVGMPQGLDLLAAYADRRARYYNYSGAGVVWERPDGILDGRINEVLRAGEALVQKIGVWNEARPGAPRNGQARLNLLTPSGLHFGQGPLQLLANDPLGSPVFMAATMLMQELIAISRK